MTDRAERVRAFLDRAGWGAATPVPLAGDLSGRRYMRLTGADGATAILMDAPPDRDASTPAFVKMTGWLRDAQLSAPQILAADAPAGLVLLEDLGDRKVSDVVSDTPSERESIYAAIIDLLILLRARAAPDLARPDAGELVRMTALAEQHYPGLDAARLAPFLHMLETILADLLTDPSSVSLRDFHADNLMWLPDRPGLARLGLLDYQDAFITHPVYDLVSLLTDARTQIDQDFRTRMIRDYARKTADDPDRLALAFAAFSAQRNLRILGIFCRAARAGNPAHVGKLPRVHGYLTEALGHPAFSGVAEAALAAIPVPDKAMIEALS